MRACQYCYGTSDYCRESAVVCSYKCYVCECSWYEESCCALAVFCPFDLCTNKYLIEPYRIRDEVPFDQRDGQWQTDYGFLEMNTYNMLFYERGGRTGEHYDE